MLLNVRIYGLGYSYSVKPSPSIPIVISAVHKTALPNSRINFKSAALLIKKSNLNAARSLLAKLV